MIALLTTRQELFFDGILCCEDQAFTFSWVSPVITSENELHLSC